MPRTYEALSRAAAVAFAKGPVGSTKGVDELLLNRVAVVGENREYPAVSQGDWGEYEGKTLLVLVYRSEECIERVEVKGEWDSWQTMTQLQ
jgi:hypothetical protein